MKKMIVYDHNLIDKQEYIEFQIKVVGKETFSTSFILKVLDSMNADSLSEFLKFEKFGFGNFFKPGSGNAKRHVQEYKERITSGYRPIEILSKYLLFYHNKLNEGLNLSQFDIIRINKLIELINIEKRIHTNFRLIIVQEFKDLLKHNNNNL